MVRLILFILLFLFAIWVLQPFFKKKDTYKNKDLEERLLNSNKSNFRQQNSIFILISAALLLALVTWLLPKFGINFFSLLQKVIPIISSLRGILPF